MPYDENEIKRKSPFDETIGYDWNNDLTKKIFD